MTGASVSEAGRVRVATVITRLEARWGAGSLWAQSTEPGCLRGGGHHRQRK